MKYVWPEQKPKLLNTAWQIAIYIAGQSAATYTYNYIGRSLTVTRVYPLLFSIFPMLLILNYTSIFAMLELYIEAGYIIERMIKLS